MYYFHAIVVVGTFSHKIYILNLTLCAEAPFAALLYIYSFVPFELCAAIVRRAILRKVTYGQNLQNANGLFRVCVYYVYIQSRSRSLYVIYFCAELTAMLKFIDLRFLFTFSTPLYSLCPSLFLSLYCDLNRLLF